MKSSSPPNVILIVADDMGYGDLSCSGNSDIRTPHLDRLASEGISLLQHYSGSPLCAPARASLLTGRYNHRTGAVDVPSNRGLDRIALTETTIADAMKGAGYATGMVGKWHNGVHDMLYHPNARGFDEFVGFLNGGMDYWQWVLDVNGRPRAPDGRYLTDVFTQASLDFVERHKSEPFFLYLAYNTPHSPLQAPEALVGRYQETGKFTEAVSTIYAMIEQMDIGIGRLLEKLEALGLAENTLVLFTSDNGPVLGGSGEGCHDRYNGPFNGSKGDALEGGIRVPALLRWPDGLPRGAQTHEVVHFNDRLPTLFGLTGASMPASLGLDGQDVLPVLRGEEREVDPTLFWQRNRYEPVARANGAARDGKWKLYLPPIPEADVKESADHEPYYRGLTEPHTLMDIETYLPERSLSAPREPRLFDLDADPCEQNDLAGEHPERVASMLKRWDGWFEEMLVEWRVARSQVIQTKTA